MKHKRDDTTKDWAIPPSPTLLGDTTFLIYENININIRLGDVTLIRMRYKYRRIC